MAKQTLTVGSELPVASCTTPLSFDSSYQNSLRLNALSYWLILFWKGYNGSWSSLIQNPSGRGRRVQSSPISKFFIISSQSCLYSSNVGTIRFAVINLWRGWSVKQIKPENSFETSIILLQRSMTSCISGSSMLMSGESYLSFILFF